MKHQNHNHKRKLQKSMDYIQYSSNKKPKDGRCTECRQIKPLTRHHKIPKSEYGPNALYNIEWLCRACHDKRHGIAKIIDRMEGVNAG